MYDSMERPRYDNLLIIAGTGRNSGKTTLTCMVISRFRELKPIAIKISPHFHEPAGGPVNLHVDDKFTICLETLATGNKDTARMLEAGASEAYYIQASDENVREAFKFLTGRIPGDRPLICESPSLGKYHIPGVLFITDSNEIKAKKDLTALLKKADLVLSPLSGKVDIDKLQFSGGQWLFG
ncbi:MAG: hypothetical protein RQ743_04530 [Bacteroidales bacterium]|nr:hypothetical protein [Bacteroidales bacterium]